MRLAQFYFRDVKQMKGVNYFRSVSFRHFSLERVSSFISIFAWPIRPAWAVLKCLGGKQTNLKGVTEIHFLVTI